MSPPIRGTLVILVALLSCAPTSARSAVIRVIDDNSGRNVAACYIYLENGKGERERVGKTDANGLCPLRGGGKPGEKYIAVSEEYNPGSADCPVASAVIRVRRTTLLQDFSAKGEFFETAGEPAAAALQFRQAALIAEKNHDSATFKELEYRVAASVAKVLQVQQPFVKTERRITSSEELKMTLKDYQRSLALKPTGAVNSDTIRKMAALESSSTGGTRHDSTRVEATTTSPHDL